MALSPAGLYDRQYDGIDNRKVWMITWNPKPRFYNYDFYGENDYDLQWLTMCDKIIQIDRCSDCYSIVAEISDMGKLHCHGFVVITDKIKWHKKVLPTLRNNGFVKLNKVSKVQKKTFKYHYKDMDSTIDYIKRVPIVITPETLSLIKRELKIIKLEGINKVYKEMHKLAKPSKNQDIELMFQRHIDSMNN